MSSIASSHAYAPASAATKQSDWWIVRCLAEHYVRDAFRARLVVVLALTWAVTLVAGVWANSAREEEHAKRMTIERQALDSYYAQIPNTIHLFEQFYTVLRPRPPLAPLVAGVEYAAPGQLDYRPRFSPSFYYGDDLDPLSRFFPSPDLVTTVGIAGLIIALLLCFDAVNGEVDSHNARILMMHGASITHVYIAKLIAQVFILGLAFTIAYAFAAIVFFATAPGATLAAHGQQLFALYVVCLLYVTFAVIMFTSLSALVLRPGNSFFLGVGWFVLMVYVLPFLVELTASQVMPLTHDHQDLIQEKVIFSRVLHAKLDPDLAKANAAFKGVEPDPEVIGIKHSAFTRGMQLLSDENSEESLRQDAAYFKELDAHTDRVSGITTWVSPYFAFERAVAILADTSFANERALITNATVDRFRAYRNWWVERTKVPPQWSTMPVDKWVFAPDTTPIDFTPFRTLEYPVLSWSQKTAILVVPVAALVFFSALFFGAGVLGARRLRRGL